MRKPAFADLMREIEAEARAEGPEAIAELELMRHRYAIGGQLLVLRMKHHWTQDQLALESGVPQSEISKIERGVHNATEDTLAALARALDVELRLVPIRRPERELVTA